MVQVQPFENVTQCTFREIPMDNATLYFNRDLVFPIHRMEMRRRMLAREDADHNSQESR